MEMVGGVVSPPPAPARIRSPYSANGIGPPANLGQRLYWNVAKSTTPGDCCLPPKRPSVCFGPLTSSARGIANSYIRWSAPRAGLAPKPQALARPAWLGRFGLYGASSRLQSPDALLNTQCD